MKVIIIYHVINISCERRYIQKPPTFWVKCSSVRPSQKFYITMRNWTVAVTYINQSGVLSRPFSLQWSIECMLAASYTLVINLQHPDFRKKIFFELKGQKGKCGEPIGICSIIALYSSIDWLDYKNVESTLLFQFLLLTLFIIMSFDSNMNNLFRN